MIAAKRWAELEKRRRGLEAELKTLKEELDHYAEAALEEFAESGIRHVALDELGTVLTIHKFKHWPREGITDEQKLAAVRTAGLGDLIAERYNYQSLNARLTEAVRHGEELPAEFEAAFAWKDEPALSLRST